MIPMNVSSLSVELPGKLFLKTKVDSLDNENSGLSQASNFVVEK